MKQKTVAIVHYNTPELLDALIKSIRKFMGDIQIVILDNSDQRPFTKRIKGVKVINNRKQQLVNFDKELEKYPERCPDLAYKGNFASVKHMMSVQYLMDEVLTDGFILMDSDILLKKDISYLWDENFAASGRIIWYKGRAPYQDRLQPYVCYLNVPMLKKAGIKFYTPERCLMIHPSRNLIPAEYEVWCRERKYPKDQADDMLHIMQLLGYDLNQKGLFQAGFEVVRKNRTNQLINDITFDLLKYAAADGHIQRINQTWLSMVINHLFSDRLKVMPVSQNIITDGDLMQWYLHNSDTPIKNPAKIAPIMFGKKTDVWR